MHARPTEPQQIDPFQNKNKHIFQKKKFSVFRNLISLGIVRDKQGKIKKTPKGLENIIQGFYKMLWYVLKLFFSAPFITFLC